MTKGNARSLDKWDGDKFRLSRFLRIKQTLFREPTALTKIMKRFLLLPLLAALFISFQSCEKDEPSNTPNTSGQETPTPSDPEEPENPGTQTPETPKDQSVVVNQDGTTSTGVPFRWETNSTTIFYLNHVKYKIVDSHVEVIGVDSYELEHTLKGIATLYSPIKLNGYTYPLRVIGERAFSNSYLTSIEIPSHVIVIRYCCFEGCKNLKSISLPKELSTLGEMAFSDCSSLKSVILPEGLLRLGCQSFSNCTSLEEIKFPSSLEYIVDECFYNCQNLTSIIIPEGSQQLNFTIGAIKHCDSLKTLSLPSNANPNYFFETIKTIKSSHYANMKLDNVYLPWHSPFDYYYSYIYRTLKISVVNLHITKDLKNWYLEYKAQKYDYSSCLYGFDPENIIVLEE